MARAVARAYNGGLQGQAGLGAEPLVRELKALRQSCTEFQLKYFVLFEYFYHVHMLLQRGL